MRHRLSGLLVVLVLLLGPAALLPVGAQETAPPASTTAVASPVPQKETKADGIVIPFAYDPPAQPLLLVRARLNSGPPMRFILDASGDYGINLFHETADRLGLLPTDKPAKGAAPDATRPIKPVTLTLLNQQGDAGIRIPLENAWRQAMPPSLKDAYRQEIAGYIGAQVLLREPSSLDFGRKEWTVFKTDAAGQYPLGGGSDVTTLPLRYLSSEGPPMLDGALMPGGTTRKWTLGTASDSTILPVSAESLPADRIRARRVRYVSGDGGSTEKQIEALLSELSIGHVQTTEVVVTLQPDLTVGRLGPDFLERYNLLVIPGTAGQPGEARFAKRADFTPRVPGTAGVTLHERPGDGFLVTALAGPARSPSASSRGVQVGDFVRAVDGMRLAGVSYYTATTLLDGYAGTTAELLVETPGEPPRPVRIVRVNGFDTLPREEPRLTAPVVIPFEFDPIRSPYIMVRVRLNGGPPLPFAVDTGAEGDLMVIPSVAAGRKIVIGKREITLNGVTGTATAHFGYGANAAFVGRKGDAAFDTTQTVVAPFPHRLVLRTVSGEPVAGIVGMRTLVPYVVQFDFTRSEMRLYPPGTAPAPLPGDITMPLVPYSPNDACRFVRGGVGGTANMPLRIDTGSNHTAAGTRAALPDDARIFAKPTAFMGLGGQPALSLPFLVPVFSLGTHQERDVCVVPGETEQTARVGMDLLSRYEVTLDLPGFQMRLTRPTDYARRCRIPGTLDLVLGDRPPGSAAWPVRLAYRDGTAYKAGVRDGDCILSVDNVALRPTEDGYLVGRLLDGFAGTEATLTVRNPRGQIRTIRALRERDLMPTPDVHIAGTTTGPGFSFGFNGKGQLTVGEMSPDIAARVPLKAGDEILSVNDKSIRLYTLRGTIARLIAALESGGVVEYRRGATTGRAVIPPPPAKTRPKSSR